MNLPQQPPKYLYRYFSKAEYAECMFRHKELYFRNPDKFNDPFDCKPLLTSNRDYDEEEYIKWACGECCDEERQACEQKARTTYRSHDKAELFRTFNETIQKDLKESINEFRILCLTEKYGDILMWSHYADGHRGFVLQLDAGLIKRNFDPCMFRKVIYPLHESYPSIKDYNQHERTSMFLRTKSSHWAYEHEWRILKHVETKDELKEEGKAYPFKDGLITGIIFGCRMTSEVKNRISQWRVKYQPQIRSYDAVKDENCYNIRTLPEISK